MSILKRNILANFLGKGWSLLMGLIFVPFYIRFLGVEAYGLIGFFTTLQASVGLLDFGLSATMNREMARFSVHPKQFNEARDLARTLETVYWIVGVIIGIGVYFSAPWISTNWIQTDTLPTGSVQEALVMMGIITALQWPISLYSGGLMGLERQVLLNAIVSLVSTVRGFGSVLVLWLIAPTLTIFFSWQILINLVYLAVIVLSFWRSMPAGARLPHFDVNSLRRVWRFTAGMSATAFVTFMISQLDKVVLSRMLRLDAFGYYTLANQLNTAIKMVSSSIFTALLPRFSALFAQGDENILRRLYHQGSQLVSLVVLPASAVLAFFSFNLLSIWTHNETAAKMAAPIASVLLCGTALNNMMGLPYSLTVARGWASFGFYQNLVAAIVIVPTMVVLASHFGGIGAAAAALILSIGYLLISMPMIHRRILQGELRQWYLIDVARPFLMSFCIAGIGWWFTPRDLISWLQIPLIFGIWVAASTACVIVLPQMRERVWSLANETTKEARTCFLK